MMRKIYNHKTEKKKRPDETVSGGWDCVVVGWGWAGRQAFDVLLLSLVWHS